MDPNGFGGSCISVHSDFSLVRGGDAIGAIAATIGAIATIHIHMYEYIEKTWYARPKTLTRSVAAHPAIDETR